MERLSLQERSRWRTSVRQPKATTREPCHRPGRHEGSAGSALGLANSMAPVSSCPAEEDMKIARSRVSTSTSIRRRGCCWIHETPGPVGANAMPIVLQERHVVYTGVSGLCGDPTSERDWDDGRGLSLRVPPAAAPSGPRLVPEKFLLSPLPRVEPPVEPRTWANFRVAAAKSDCFFVCGERNTKSGIPTAQDETKKKRGVVIDYSVLTRSNRYARCLTS